MYALRQKRRPQSILATAPVHTMLTPTLLLVAAAAALSSPVPKVLYDQRQEGEWNVHADLRNFVIMVIPAQASSSTPATGGLLDFFVKSLPKRSQLKNLEKKAVPGEETLHFIESKTAPYHVDISRSKSQLARLHPDVPAVVNAEEIVIAKSPTIELVKDENPHPRIARAFLLTVPQDEDFDRKKDGKKKKEISKSVLKLLGAENDEECGPGLARDSEGVCRTIKQ
ncbi:uncharacterized protein LOC103314279 [Tribolium castaneum]|uniref:Uncharacterized protein n=1 Tax=Tribolium castaneum TaxID=7070 RepID=D6WZ74_TRICA|nr:PREDICTED: uncharacterized protein LOC103314279 [Tribolium castaneum]EFA09749.1 hypothetical protein TcasGA2_TC011888 [Tribolium castaneum]|eukprot:XP_008198107.1 PREDICTED: uncharacterized protein LOC103314279 [Tribolium castaneum]